MTIEFALFCPICGYQLAEEWGTGDICPCCGNESGFDDRMDRDDIIVRDGEYYWSMLKQFIRYSDMEKEVPKEIIEYLNSTKYTREEAWDILRNKWIEDGFRWKWTDKNEKPNNWNKEMAIKQLENINLFHD